MVNKKREQWRLPKEFKTEPIVDGCRQRSDEEPRILDLVKHASDRSLSTQEFNKCCDCGLIHLHTYNVIKTPDGNWFLVKRAYRI